MKRLIAIALCFAMLTTLCGCGGSSGETTVPTTPPDPAAAYAEAAAKLVALENAELVVSLSEDMDLGADHFQTTSKYSVTLLGIGTDVFAASSKETIFNGDVTLTIKEVFQNGMVYTAIGSNCYKSELTAEAYLEDELPLMLLDASLYGTVSQDENGTFTFTDATDLESWCYSPYADPETLTVTATATLGEDGLPSKYTYHAAYAQGAADMVLTVTMEIKTPTATEITAPSNADKYLAVEQDENGLTMADIAAQISMAAGYLSQTTSAVATSTDVIISQAAGFIDSAEITTAVYGTGNDTIAFFETNAQFKTADEIESTTTTETFLDGVLTTVEDDGEPKTDTRFTGSHIASYVEDELQYLIPVIEDITGFTLTVIGDTALLEYTYDDEYAEFLENYYCQTYFRDGNLLRNLASGTAVTANGGYMGIDLTTGMPLSMGTEFSMTHTIDGYDYILSSTSQLSVQLGSEDAYETITGEELPIEQPEELAKPVFYKVTGSNGETMWLLGTIHVGDERTAFLPQEIYDAFAASDALAVEFDSEGYTSSLMEDEEAILAYLNAMFYMDGTTLADHLTDETLYENTIRLLKATGNYDAYYAEVTKPVFHEMTIQNFYISNGYRLSSDFGVDHQLENLAREQEKEILSVESGEFQMDLLGNLSEALQELLLKEILEYGHFATNYSSLQLFEMWCRGDEAELIEYLNEEDEDSDLTDEEKALYEEYENALGGMRNVDMLAVAQEYLNSGKTVFYAVGLAHLLADDGLVNTLREAGYTVELVSYAE